MGMAGGNGDSRFVQSRHFWAAWAFQKFPSVSKSVINAGDIAAAGFEAETMAGNPLRLFKDRTHLWTEMADSLVSMDLVVGLEFGVASGQATRWWLQRLDSPSVTWKGFDLFTGNPVAWREHSQGAWDRAGHPPAIADSRVEWIVGDASVTSLGISELIPPTASSLIVLLDLNLAEPTASVVAQLAELKVPNVIVYFDDFYDTGQRSIAAAMVRAHPEAQFIGRTAKALAFSFAN